MHYEICNLFLTCFTVLGKCLLIKLLQNLAFMGCILLILCFKSGSDRALTSFNSVTKEYNKAQHQTTSICRLLQLSYSQELAQSNLFFSTDWKVFQMKWFHRSHKYNVGTEQCLKDRWTDKQVFHLMMLSTATIRPI